MATEYKLSYTATDINARLGKINQLSENVADLQDNINAVQSNVEQVQSNLEQHNISTTSHTDIRAEIDQLTDNKQNKLNGTIGQVVGFDADGNAIAQVNPQPNWNQNDENTSDYVKNRTHYSIENITTLVDEKVVNYTAEFTASLGNNINLVNGEKYCLICNGIEYESIATLDSSGWMYVFFDTDDGIRLQLSISSNDIEHALWFDCYDKESQELITGIYTIKVFTRAEEIHHLDPKYIKDMYYETDLVETVVLEEQNIEVKYSGGYIFGDFSNPPRLTANQLYKIIFNGVEYECMSRGDEYGSVNLGGSMISSQKGTSSNFPFAIDYYENNGQIRYCHFYTPIPGIYTISITAIDKEITKILPQYLPQSVGKNIENTQCFIKSEPVVAETGAEIFNDYTSNIATGLFSHAEGSRTIASGMYSHAEGRYTMASNDNAHAEGDETIASGSSSHAEGCETEASGYYSHAEGMSTISSGHCSHAEGQGTKSSSSSSHAEGLYTIASGDGSHAEGQSTKSSRSNAHAEGYYTTAASPYQHVQGKFNIEDSNDIYAHIVGNGNDDEDDSRSNAHTVDWQGNAWFAGDVYIGSTSGKNKDEGSKKLLTSDDIPDVTWENLSSKPMYHINWDGNKNGRDVLTSLNEMSLVRVSNLTFGISDLESAGFELVVTSTFYYVDFGLEVLIDNKHYSLREDGTWLNEDPLYFVENDTGFYITTKESSWTYVDILMASSDTNGIYSTLIERDLSSLYGQNVLSRMYVSGFSINDATGLGKKFSPSVLPMDCIQSKITGTPGQFVVIGDDGNVTTTAASDALTHLGAAPAYTYGTTDLTAGTSSLATGTLYFVYESGLDHNKPQD